MCEPETEFEEQVLAEFDKNFDRGAFPIPGNVHWNYGSMRLAAFGSRQDWLIAFSVAEFMPRADAFGAVTYAYGTGQAKPYLGNPPKPQTWGFDYLSSGQLWFDTDDPKKKFFSFSVAIADEIRPFRPTPADYEAAGVDLESDWNDETKILRLLVYLCDDLLHPNADQFLEFCRPNAKLPLIVYLKDWLHPNLDDPEFPSDSPSFLAIARAIERRDPSFYDPSLGGNTHWSNWID